MATSLGNKRILADNLTRLLNQHNMTRHDLSDALDIPYSTVSAWCNGTLYPRIDRIEMMAKFFNVTKSDLVEKPEDVMDDLLEKAFRSRPDMKKLFKLANNAEPRDVYTMIKMMEAITNNGGNNN